MSISYTTSPSTSTAKTTSKIGSSLDSPEAGRRGESDDDPGVYQVAPGGSKSGLCSYSSEITQPPPSEPLLIKQLEKWPLQKAAKHILAWPRFQTCYQVPVASTVDLVRNAESRRAFYKNLATCGGVWVCPVCASKITERRRLELENAVTIAKSLELDVYLRTLTVPHTGADPLGDLLTKFSDALRKMKNRKPHKAWSKSVGLVGTIRALEVTQGQPNGWHVHTHEILFCRSSRQKNGFARSSRTNAKGEVRPVVPPVSVDVLPFWKSACLKAGLNEPDHHGVDIKTGDDAIGDYVSKWGIAHEATKSMTKRGRCGRRSPWDLLREFIMTGDEDEAALFREYAENFKGKRQLVWSDGLRDLLGLAAEKSDEEIAAEEEKGNELLASLSLSDWRCIIKYHYDVRGQLLLVATCGPDAVREFLEKVKRGEGTV